MWYYKWKCIKTSKKFKGHLEVNVQSSTIDKWLCSMSNSKITQSLETVGHKLNNDY